jgi:hypothetical protein
MQRVEIHEMVGGSRRNPRLRVCEHVLVDDEDYSRVRWITWTIKRGNIGRLFAKANDLDGHSILLHRYILGYQPGDPVQVGFIRSYNRTGENSTLDCRKQNLRIVTNSRLNLEKPGHSTSRFLGVYWQDSMGMWGASAGLKRRVYRLGFYFLEEEAARAYNRFVRDNHPEGFKNYNDVDPLF